MGYLERYNLMSSGVILAKTTVALIDAAFAIINESPTEPDHALRLQLANNIIRDPVGQAREAMIFVLQNTTIQAAGENATDNDVQYQVLQIIDTLVKRLT